MSENSRIVKKLLPITTLSLFAIAFVIAAPSAFATSAANCSPINCNMQNVTINIGVLGLNPCNGQPISTDSYVTGNFQTHGSSDGTHFTGNLEGQITITQDNGVVLTGHIHDWFGGNTNKGGTTEGGGTANFDVTGSDGSSFHINANSHTTITPAGAVTVNVNNLVCH